MNLATLRAHHPGLHAEIYESGFEAARELAESHLRLAEAAGSVGLARYAIIQADSIQHAFATYSRAASKSDATSAAFVRECERQRINPSDGSPLSSTSPSGGADASVDQLAAQLTKLRSSRGAGPTGGDVGDQVVALMEKERGTPSPSRATHTPVNPRGDVGDRVVELMQRERAGGEVRR